VSKEQADMSAVGRWFLGNSLPWSDDISSKLLTLGVNCVEHLKECTEYEWTDLFRTETPIMRRVAARVFAALKSEGDLDPKKCASQLGFVRASRSPPSLVSLSRKGIPRDDGSSFKLTEKGITVKFISRDTKKRMRLAVLAAAKAGAAAVMDDAGGLGEASLGGVTTESSGGAGDAGDGLDSVSALSSGVGVEEIGGGEISDSDSGEEKDTGLELSPRLESWRDARCCLSKDLFEPAPSDERLTWDNDLIGIDDRAEDLEDPQGHYKSLRCSKVTSDDDIDREFKRQRKKYRIIALKCHPDKTADVNRHEKFQRADMRWNRVQRSFGVLGAADDSGCYALRVSYDREGERRRDVMEVVRAISFYFCYIDFKSPLKLHLFYFVIKAMNAVYNVDTSQRASDIKEMLKRDSIYKKRSSNITTQASMPILTKIAKRWMKNGQQHNHTRLLLCNAFDAQYSNSEIALQIRRYAFRCDHFNESNRAKVSKYIAY